MHERENIKCSYLEWLIVLVIVQCSDSSQAELVGGKKMKQWPAKHTVEVWRSGSADAHKAVLGPLVFTEDLRLSAFRLQSEGHCHLSEQKQRPSTASSNTSKRSSLISSTWYMLSSWPALGADKSLSALSITQSTLMSSSPQSSHSAIMITCGGETAFRIRTSRSAGSMMILIEEFQSMLWYCFKIASLSPINLIERSWQYSSDKVKVLNIYCFSILIHFTFSEH